MINFLIKNVALTPIIIHKSPINIKKNTNLFHHSQILARQNYPKTKTYINKAASFT